MIYSHLLLARAERLHNNNNVTTVLTFHITWEF